MKPKKLTQLQRINTLESIVAQMWRFVRQQGDEIDRIKKNNKSN